MMKALVMKVMLFLLFVFGIFTMLGLSTSMLIRRNASFRFDSEPRMMVLGNSHPENAFDDALISSFKNMARSGESYFYTYYKAKKVFSQNPKIDTVFIEFGNSNIEIGSNEWIWGDNILMSRFPLFALFMDREGISILYRKNIKYLALAIAPVVRNNLFMLLKKLNYLREFGGYVRSDRARLEAAIAAVEKQKFDANPPLSSTNIEYLSKLIDYCDQRSIKVYLIRSPVHKKYPYFINEGIFRGLLATKFPSVEFLDFSRFVLVDSEFSDLEHLNYKGAHRFSTWFDGLLKNGILQQQNKQTTINAEMEKASSD